MWLKIKQSECNLSCVFCPPEGRHKSELDFDFMMKLIEAADKVGLKRIWWTGGEPFLFDNFSEIASYASKLDFEQKMSTNGLLLHKHKEVLDAFSRINISFHSLNKKTYAAVTNGGNLLALQENINRTVGKTLVRLNIVLGKYNIDEVNDIIAYANKLSIVPRFILLRDRGCKKSINWIDTNRISEKQFWDKILGEVQPTEVVGNNIKASYYKTKNYTFGVIRLTDKCEEEHCNIIFIDSKRRLYNCRGLNRKDIVVQNNLTENLKNTIETKKVNYGNTCSPKDKN